MVYVVSLLVEGDNKERLRAFFGEGPARLYVERLGERLGRLTDAGRTNLYLAHATLYIVVRTGRLSRLDSFDGHDRGDGLWHGWESGLPAELFRSHFRVP
jgi:hypothetical protein